MFGWSSCGHRLGLGPESPQLGEAGQAGIADHLQGDDAVEVDLPGPIDDPHPAPGELADHLVIAQEAGHSRGA